VRLAVSYRWNKGGGREDEARECFRLFDKRDKGYITANDLKQVLPNYLEFPVTDSEISELIQECDPNGSGNIVFRDFARLYNA
jgi:Ca2+-binding EF-hand superfamily protein